MDENTSDSDSGIRILPYHTRAPFLYAGFWRRVVAWLIDFLIIGTVQVILILFFGTWLLLPWAIVVGGHGEAMARLIDTRLLPFGVVVVWLYYAACESSRWQATPGKLALGLSVTDEYGRRIGFDRATGRFFGKFVSALVFGLGFLLAGWSVRKQALHDFMAACCVVRKAGLAVWQREPEMQPGMALASSAAPAARAGVPGWAIALIVIVGSVFVVLPVLAILAAIAIPAYQGYTVRAEVAEGVRLTERPRALVAEYIGQRGALPDSNSDLGLPRPEAIQERYVASVRIIEGQVVVTYGNEASRAISGGHVVISPEGNAAMLRWRCSSPDISELYLPSSCRR